jgi:hypothetical protein
MDIEINENAHYSSLYLQVALVSLPFGDIDGFVRCIMRRVPPLLHPP